MYRNLKFQVLILTLALLFGAGQSRAATLSPSLQQTLSSLSDSASVGVVIVSFNTTTGLSNSHLDLLRSVGIHQGLTMTNLGMVAMPATAAQVRALASNSAVRSIWTNDRL